MEEIERSKVRQLAEEIVKLIDERQYRTLKLMNSGTIELYWSIGEMNIRIIECNLLLFC